ncbi:hypothetical protein GCM10011342_09780 [Aquisalinus flavus]|uniref:Uncharacterized protein n=1 Tax=Aquisalinus flavus TaxID=1526572 RepID=A0A8J2Y5X5_9PROT|nr:hypothetical protein GCM10011342_09780 [Aquisalinus flavus]
MAQHRRIEQVAGIIAGKGTRRPVGPLQAGCEADDQHFDSLVTLGRAERRNRAVEPIRMSRLILAPERDEARAKRAIGYRLGWYYLCAGSHE